MPLSFYLYGAGTATVSSQPFPECPRPFDELVRCCHRSFCSDSSGPETLGPGSFGNGCLGRNRHHCLQVLPELVPLGSKSDGGFKQTKRVAGMLATTHRRLSRKHPSPGETGLIDHPARSTHCLNSGQNLVVIQCQPARRVSPVGRRQATTVKRWTSNPTSTGLNHLDLKN